jgi:hypothetical protein
MEIGWTDVGSRGYILVSCAHSNTSFRVSKDYCSTKSCFILNNSGTAKVKIVKNERDPPLFTSKLLIKFQNILRNTIQVIIRHRVKILFSVVFLRMFWNFISSLSVKRGGSLSFLTIFTFAVPELLDLIMLLIKFQNILRNTTQVIIRQRVKILFYVISSPITLERQKWKLSKMKGILLSSPLSRCYVVR